MTTPLDIITQCLKDCGAFGVGQQPLSEDVNDAFTKLNWMLAQWQRKRFLIWHLVDVSLVSTGANSYTIGTGANFNVARPDRLEAAFFRQIVTSAPNQIDYPLRIIESREDYNEISLKQLQTFPAAVFYDAGYPTGTLYFWPVPQASIYELHVTLKEQLAQFTGLNEAISLPAEYMAAIHLNMTVRLRSFYQQPRDPVLEGMARDSLKTIRGANGQIPQLKMPADLIRPGVYNPYSDQIR